jgi:hypothetical protein
MVLNHKYDAKIKIYHYALIRYTQTSINHLHSLIIHLWNNKQHTEFKEARGSICKPSPLTVYFPNQQKQNSGYKSSYQFLLRQKSKKASIWLIVMNLLSKFIC